MEKQEPPALVAAGWCVVHTGESEEGAPGCDVGLGVSLQRWRRWSLVSVIGSKTIGAGVAFVASRPERGPVIAIAAGVVAPYDDTGIAGDELEPAIGATFSFGGPR